LQNPLNTAKRKVSAEGTTFHNPRAEDEAARKTKADADAAAAATAAAAAAEAERAKQEEESMRVRLLRARACVSVRATDAKREVAEAKRKADEAEAKRKADEGMQLLCAALLLLIVARHS
jgi:hypothetical protein